MTRSTYRIIFKHLDIEIVRETKFIFIFFLINRVSFEKLFLKTKRNYSEFFFCLYERIELQIFFYNSPGQIQYYFPTFLAQFFFF